MRAIFALWIWAPRLARQAGWMTMAAMSVALPVTSWAWSGGPPDGNTNAPGEGVCVACHNSFELNSGQGSLVLDGLPDRYALGETYRLEIVLADPNARRWGFELTAKDQNRHGAGDFTVVDADHTQISDPGGNSAQYVKQRSAGTYAGQADGATWEVDWTAPDEDIGEIGFYVAGNAANNDGRDSSDYIYATSTAIEAEEPPPPDEFTCVLAPGWNFVSFPVTPTVTALDSIFAALIAAGNPPIVREVSGAFYDPDRGVDFLHNWDFRDAYQINVAHAADVVFSGAYTDSLYRYLLDAGWNWISYPSAHDSIFVTEAMAPLADELLFMKDNAGLIYVPDIAYNQLGYIKPGGAWMIKLANDSVNFGWPELQDVFDSPEPPAVAQHFTAPTNTGRNMHLFVASRGGIDPQAGDEIGILYYSDGGDRICGAAVASGDPFPIVIWGDDNTTDAVEGPANGDSLSVTYWSAAADTELAMIPVEAPGDSSIEYQNDAFIQAFLYFQGPPDSAPPSSLIPLPSSLLLSAFPNPLNATTVVSYQLSVVSFISLKLYNISGREVLTLAEGWQAAGEHRVTLDGESLVTGLYLVSLESGSGRQMKTVVLIR